MLGGEEQEFLLAGPIESGLAAEHVPTPLSYLSPVGRAIWGRQVGEKVSVNRQEVEILSIHPLDTA